MKHDTPPTFTPLLSRAQVERLTGLSTTSLYRAMRRGDFPEPLRVSERSVRWRTDEIESWIEERPRAAGIVGEAA
ncbi:helix-turn-helix transcriptional regulator [Candidatus Poriferisodalis sp.]|uniref:helix-turn-helix transcriptional regulator n=1 Tax=Candidatus Poriferisodalis sp. TaxID=3101277 RepID=UPI003B01F7E9